MWSSKSHVAYASRPPEGGIRTYCLPRPSAFLRVQIYRGGKQGNYRLGFPVRQIKTQLSLCAAQGEINTMMPGHTASSGTNSNNGINQAKVQILEVKWLTPASSLSRTYVIILAARLLTDGPSRPILTKLKFANEALRASTQRWSIASSPGRDRDVLVGIYRSQATRLRNLD